MSAEAQFNLESIPGREARARPHELGSDILLAVRAELLRVASHEDALAVQEAVHVPYWAAIPESVVGHRAAARAIREQANRFLETHLGKGA